MLHGRQVEFFLVVEFLDSEVGDVGVAIELGLLRSPRLFSFLSHGDGGERKPLICQDEVGNEKMQMWRNGKKKRTKKGKEKKRERGRERERKREKSLWGMGLAADFKGLDPEIAERKKEIEESLDLPLGLSFYTLT